MVRQARGRLPEQPEDRPRPRHRGQRRDHGLRQHGRRLGHRRRLHPRPEHRREGALRRVPAPTPRARTSSPASARRAKIAQMKTDMPEVYDEFERIGEQLEKHYRDVQDLEFTIERGKLYMLQTRTAKRTAEAAVKIAVDMVDEGVITKDEAARADRAGPRRPAPARPRSTRRARGRRRRSANGLNASPGAAVGRAVFDADTAVEWVGQGERVDPRPDRDLARRLPRDGRRAGHPDRARRRDQPRRGRRPPDRQAVRRRRRRAPRRLPRHDAHRQRHRRFEQGDWISLDGTTGEVFLGALPTIEARFEDQPELQTHPRLGRRDPPAAGLDQRRQARRGRPGPLATAPRASACAGPSTCSARASGSRSCAARSSWRSVATRAKAKRDAGGS